MFRRKFVEVLVLLCVAINAEAQLPSNVILVKGAEPSASDPKTPVPEAGRVTNKVYQNSYFGLSYALPADWVQGYEGPPPSEQGSYVLAQLQPAATFKGEVKGTILITAQDLFFAHPPSSSAMDMVKLSRDRLPNYYEVERPLTEVKVGDRSFARFDYLSAAAQLHWYILATQIRCHAVQFVLTSQDVKLLEQLVQDLDKMKLPAEAGLASGTGGGDSPLCVPNYATGKNVTSKVDPVLTERKFNAIPVRIIINRKGRIRHVHVLSAFSDQAKIITDALMQWEFKPYVVNGETVEVETGLMFGFSRLHVKGALDEAQ
jgi:hypothetical protein